MQESDKENKVFWHGAYYKSYRNFMLNLKNDKKNLLRSTRI